MVLAKSRTAREALSGNCTPRSELCAELKSGVRRKLCGTKNSCLENSIPDSMVKMRINFGSFGLFQFNLGWDDVPRRILGNLNFGVL